ncbi:H-2 class II histocompatibility antigen, A-Q alpha chain [Kryptolebias marmoratus]|uniref:H-2 class II histocompatibility antigen, A-Q alpha chain-like n=1 Tax=Kryptolebias marmoratus TaxID=37003 RepID=A0A3Q3BPD1_KRYMA|nr:H-2 class II histocompatibility antigen, A-Q alpha chain [Kryptolebias marmoratus]
MRKALCKTGRFIKSHLLNADSKETKIYDRAFKKSTVYNMDLKVILLFSGAVCICAERSHRLCFHYGCFDSSDTQLCVTLDDDEIGYADFTKDVGVWESRLPLSFHDDSAFRFAKTCQWVCKKDMHKWKPDKSVSVTKDPPQVVMYPRDEVVKDEENTLICFINKFFPPTIKIRWTKNDEDVEVEDPFIKVMSQFDGTFYVFSYLNFVPEDGDIYGCTVEHEALDEPKTRFWDVELDEMSSDAGPAVFFGIVTLGLLGGAAGIFFFLKGHQHHGSISAAG